MRWYNSLQDIADQEDYDSVSVGGFRRLGHRWGFLETIFAGGTDGRQTELYGIAKKQGGASV